MRPMRPLVTPALNAVVPGPLLLVLVAVLVACESGSPRAHAAERWPIPLGPYAGAFTAEVEAAGLQRGLQRAGEQALVEVEGTLGVRIDRTERLLLRLVDARESNAWWTVDEAWIDRVRRRRVSIHLAPILRGDTELERSLRGALAEALLAERATRPDAPKLPPWIATGAPLYLSRRGAWLHRIAPYENGLGDPEQLEAYARFLVLEETGGPRRLAELLPALERGRDEREVLTELFGQPVDELERAFRLRRVALQTRREDEPSERLLQAAAGAPPARLLEVMEKAEAAGERPLRGDVWRERKAAALRAVGRADEAAAVLVERLRLWPAGGDGESPVRTLLAEVHRERGDPRAALACLESVPLDAAPRDPARALVLVRAGRDLGFDRVVEAALSGVEAGAERDAAAAWLADRRGRPLEAERAARLADRLAAEVAAGAVAPAVLAPNGDADRIGERTLAVLQRVALDREPRAIPAVVAFGARLPGDEPTRWLRMLAALDREDV